MRVLPAVLVVDDEESILLPLATFLETKGYPVTTAGEGQAALKLAASAEFPVVISDIYIDRVTGLDVLRTAKKANPDCAVILMTARGSLETTVEAEAGGVFEYLAKPVDLTRLLAAVERASAAPPEESPDTAPPLEGVLAGNAAAMVELYKQIASAARADSTVLIFGETGTGKELAAQAIHRNSRRKIKRLVTVDCGAISENLWESELFGAVKGAFTGADRDRTGLVREADGGTLFLDEIGEIPLSFQTKLLRLLQAREIRRVGASASEAVDVRILAATNRRLEEMTEAGKFREDLYHRLNVLRVAVPPLRERRSDIRLLAQRFLEQSNQRNGKAVRLQAAASAALENYSWPGNVRELENAIERLVARAWGSDIAEAEVQTALALAKAPPEALDDVERQHVEEVIRQCEGNITRAAERLGIQRRTLYKMLERWKAE